MLRAMRAVDKHKRPIPFSMEVCTWNKSTRMGGERLVVKKAIIYNGRKQQQKTAITQTNAAPAPPKRNPNHDLNQTINILLLPSNQIRTVHIRLIERFNNKTVYD